MCLGDGQSSREASDGTVGQTAGAILDHTGRFYSGAL